MNYWWNREMARRRRVERCESRRRTLEAQGWKKGTTGSCKDK